MMDTYTVTSEACWYVAMLQPLLIMMAGLQGCLHQISSKGKSCPLVFAFPFSQLRSFPPDPKGRSTISQPPFQKPTLLRRKASCFWRFPFQPGKTTQNPRLCRPAFAGCVRRARPSNVARQVTSHCCHFLPNHLENCQPTCKILCLCEILASKANVAPSWISGRDI